MHPCQCTNFILFDLAQLHLSIKWLTAVETNFLTLDPRETPLVRASNETVVDADLGETEVGGDFFRDCC